MAEWCGGQVELLSPKAALAKWPLLRIDDVLGAAWLPHDGKVVPKELAIALAKGAESRGANVLENTRVLKIQHRNERATGVETQQGTIKAEYVLLAGGMWTRELGLG